MMNDNVQTKYHKHISDFPCFGLIGFLCSQSIIHPVMYMQSHLSVNIHL